MVAEPSSEIPSSIQERLSAVRSAIDSVPEDRPDEVIAYLTTDVRRVLDLVEVRFANADRMFLTEGLLGRVRGHLDELATAITGNVSQSSNVRVKAVRPQVDALIEGLAGLPSVAADVEVVLLARAEVERLREEANEARQSLESAIAALSQRVDEETASHQTSINEFSSTRENLSTEVETLRQTIEDTRKSQQETFEARQKAQSTEHKKQLDATAQEWKDFQEAQRAEAKELRESFEASATKSRDEMDEQAAEVLQRLKEMRDEAVKLHGELGHVTQSALYKKQSGAESKQASVWRATAVGLAVAAGAVLMALAFLVEVVNPTQVVAKVAAAGFIGSAATYAARESARHRGAARRLHDNYLAIASLRPYLANLDNERRDALVEEFAYVFFARKSNEEIPDEALTAPDRIARWRDRRRQERKKDGKGNEA